MADKNTTPNPAIVPDELYSFKNPEYVIRTCNEDGTPIHGNEAFIWPRSGPVADSNWAPTPHCGEGLHACRISQCGKHYLLDTKYPLFLVCEVEASEVVDVGGKVKFPRCNVIFSGSWRGALRCLRSHSSDLVPSNTEFMKQMGWEHLPEEAYETPGHGEPVVYTSGSMDPIRVGDVNNPVSKQEFLDTELCIGRQGLKKFVKRNISDVEASRIASVMARCDYRRRMSLWSGLQRNVDNLFKIHPYIEKLMVATASGADTSKLTVPAESKKASTSTTTKAPAPKKRGRR